MEQINDIIHERLLELAISGDVGAGEMLGFTLDDATVVRFAEQDGLGNFPTMDDQAKRTVRLIVAAQQALDIKGPKQGASEGGWL